MKLYEKIKSIRKEKTLKLTALHARIQEIFGSKTLTYRSLQRIEAGETDGRGSSLYQICMGLGLTLKELKDGTEEESSSVELTRRKDGLGRYIYNNNAYAQIRTTNNMPFLALELFLEPNAVTRIEKDPDGETLYKKWVHVLTGSPVCYIQGKRYALKKGDSLAFDSRIAHYFENKSNRTARCIIVQHPRHI